MNYHKLKIIKKKNNDNFSKIFIDDKEIKGITKIKIEETQDFDNNINETSITIKIGFIESLEIIVD